MNETAWLAGADPSPMLKGVQSSHTGRKLRLYSCACCRRLQRFLPEESRTGVEVAERYAEDLSSRAELEAAHARANAAVLALPRVWSYDVLRARYATSAAAQCSSRSAAAVPGAASIASAAAHAVALTVAVAVPEAEFAAARAAAREAEMDVQAALLRDIFGNPFRLPPFSPDWRTDTAIQLTRQIDQTGDFSLMPILADSLQDAGCECPEVLDHCRGRNRSGTAPGGPCCSHVRGCWVVDLVLDRS